MRRGRKRSVRERRQRGRLRRRNRIPTLTRRILIQVQVAGLIRTLTPLRALRQGLRGQGNDLEKDALRGGVEVPRVVIAIQTTIDIVHGHSTLIV